MDRLEQPPVRLYVAGVVIAVLAVFTGSYSYERAQALRRAAAQVGVQGAVPVADTGKTAVVSSVGGAQGLHAKGNEGSTGKSAGGGAGQNAGESTGGSAAGSAAAGAGQSTGSQTAGNGISHTVKQGETLTRIAQRYGVSVSSLQSANGLSSDRIKAGQRLTIPEAQRHTVAQGDSFWALSRRYGISVESLLAANPSVDPGHLVIGSDVVIPGGEVAAAPVTAAPSMDEPAVEALAGKFTWPLIAPISSHFGPRDGRNHNGVDLAANMGDDIRAARDGTVLIAGEVSGYGNTVVLEHEDGTRTLYAHASVLKVTAGQKVRQGDLIALVGSTGRSTGPHLHFEIIVNDQPRDPLLYLPKR